MTGLLKKDFLLIIKNLSFIFLFPFIVVIIPVIKNSALLMPLASFMIALIFASQILTTMALDEMAHWKRNVSAMPIPSREEVGSKYILAFSMSLMSLIVVCIVGLLSADYLQITMDVVLFYMVLSFCIGILYNLIIIPAAFKLGTSKCKYVLFVFVIIPTATPFILDALNIKINFELIKLNIYEIMLLCLVVILFLMAISYLVAVRIQKKKYCSL
jgi:ABC-2 type transport system permease protein